MERTRDGASSLHFSALGPAPLRLGITDKMNPTLQRADSPGKAKTLIVVAWVASLVALPVFFFAVIGLGMGPSTPTISTGEFLMLLAGPGVACAALFEATARCHVTPRRLAAMAVPAILALAELAFTFMIWSNG